MSLKVRRKRIVDGQGILTVDQSTYRWPAQLLEDVVDVKQPHLPTGGPNDTGTAGY